MLLQLYFVAEYFKHFRYFKHVHLDSIGKVNQQMRRIFNSASHVKTGSRYNLCLAPSGQDSISALGSQDSLS
jgi:hypothetical protein